jgi:non-homologous end joining protein Ku
LSRPRIQGARACWNGFPQLSLLLSIALFPATWERAMIGFHRINKITGKRIEYQKVDAGTGRVSGS